MKRIVTVFLLLAMLVCALASCSAGGNDPVSMARVFCDKDYLVDIAVHPDTIESECDELGVDTDDVYCFFVAVPEKKDSGYGDYTKLGGFFFCESNEAAKDLCEELEDLLDDSDGEFSEVEDAIVKCEGKLVFVGCEDTWEDRVAK